MNKLSCFSWLSCFCCFESNAFNCFDLKVHVHFQHIQYLHTNLHIRFETKTRVWSAQYTPSNDNTINKPYEIGNYNKCLLLLTLEHESNGTNQQQNALALLYLFTLCAFVQLSCMHTSNDVHTYSSWRLEHNILESDEETFFRLVSSSKLSILLFEPIYMKCLIAIKTSTLTSFRCFSERPATAIEF